MKILMLPAGQDVAINPYTARLSDSLKAIGLQIEGFTSVIAAGKRVDIVHVHWPHNFAATGSFTRAFARSFFLLMLCSYHKLRGAKVIWTVHDLRSFAYTRPNLEDSLMWAFTRLTDGLIFLNNTSRSQLLSSLPHLEHRPYSIIPHGIYGDNYPPPTTQIDARRSLNLATSDTILLVPGDIKPYKNLPLIIKAVSKLQQAQLLLLVAGECDPESYSDEIDSLITQAKASGARIEWRPQRPDAAALALLIDAADAIALPYSLSWNSGMAVLCLERERRLVTSDSPGFLELAQEVGRDWAIVSEPEHFERAIQHIQDTRPTPPSQDSIIAFKDRRQWPAIAILTSQFYSLVFKSKK